MGITCIGCFSHANLKFSKSLDDVKQRKPVYPEKECLMNILLKETRSEVFSLGDKSFGDGKSLGMTNWWKLAANQTSVMRPPVYLICQSQETHRSMVSGSYNSMFRPVTWDTHDSEDDIVDVEDDEDEDEDEDEDDDDDVDERPGDRYVVGEDNALQTNIKPDQTRSYPVWKQGEKCGRKTDRSRPVRKYDENCEHVSPRINPAQQSNEDFSGVNQSSNSAWECDENCGRYISTIYPAWKCEENYGNETLPSSPAWECDENCGRETPTINSPWKCDENCGRYISTIYPAWKCEENCGNETLPSNPAWECEENCDRTNVYVPSATGHKGIGTQYEECDNKGLNNRVEECDENCNIKGYLSRKGRKICGLRRPPRSSGRSVVHFGRSPFKSSDFGVQKRPFGRRRKEKRKKRKIVCRPINPIREPTPEELHAVLEACRIAHAERKMIGRSRTKIPISARDYLYEPPEDNAARICGSCCCAKGQGSYCKYVCPYAVPCKFAFAEYYNWRWLSPGTWGQRPRLCDWELREREMLFYNVFACYDALRDAALAAHAKRPCEALCARRR